MKGEGAWCYIAKARFWSSWRPQKRACAQRTLESLARIEEGAQGGALVERVTTTRTAKDGTATTTVRERFTAPDWHADGWGLSVPI